MTSPVPGVPRRTALASDTCGCAAPFPDLSNYRLAADEAPVACVTDLTLDDQFAKVLTLLRESWPSLSEIGPCVVRWPVGLRCQGFPQSSECIKGEGGQLQLS